MDAFYIISKKSKEILLFKEYNIDSNPKDKINSFILNIGKLFSSNSKSPFIFIDKTLFIYYPSSQINIDIVYVILITNTDVYIPSYINILISINESLTHAFKSEPTTELIRENIILILLMLDQYLWEGAPILTERNIMSSLVSPYGLTDKITEKIIGLAKTYDITLLKDYISTLQMNNELYKYKQDISKSDLEIYFDYIDYLHLTCDKRFNIQKNTCHSEININSKISNNIPLNILLNLPYQMLSFSFDNCITSKRKNLLVKKTIDCLCKHGSFCLMKMIPILNNNFIKLPFKLFLNCSLANNNQLKISIEIELTDIKGENYELDNININLKFIDERGVKNSNLSANIGSFEFNEKKNEANWCINKFNKNNGTNAILKGHVIVHNDYIFNNEGNCIFNMKCDVEKFSVSGGNLVKVNLEDKDKFVSKFYKNKTIIEGIDLIF